ncbi:MAG: bacterial Ig-like domain-containing protein [Clostridia bacterium]|nr:bacterial Ig-like domain-containing protein [Clostridia bacterium]
MQKKKRLFTIILISVLVLAFAMPLATSPGLLENIINVGKEHEIILSASVFDYGDESYFCDDNGTVFLSEAESETNKRIAELGAVSIAVKDDTIYYADSFGKILRYEIASGKSTAVYKGSLCEGNFGLYDNTLFFIGDQTLFKVNGKKATALVEIEGLRSMKILDRDTIILYANNDHYHPETPGEEFLHEEKNDQYDTYVYSLSSDLVTVYDEHLEEANAVFTPTSISERLNLSNLSSSTSSGDAITINGKTFPIDDTISGARAYYPVGSFFTYNGKSCTCHGRNTCVSNPSDCNCIRYWPNKSNRQVDLAAVQCYGFARFCMWYAYGYYDNTNKTYNAFGGSLSAGKWSANTIKNIFLEVGPGGHLRTGSGHSLFVISVSTSGFITYECNKSRTGHNCEIYTRSCTWDTFYSTYGSRDMLFYNIPKDISSTGQIITDDKMQVGMYQTLADELNLRSGPSTSYSKLGQIPKGTPLAVTEVVKGTSYNWGYTSYNGIHGWVALEYAVYVSSAMTGLAVTQPPNKTQYYEGDSFSTEGLEISAEFADGTSLVISGYVCTGYNMNTSGIYNVNVSCNGFTTSFQIEVTKRKVYPTEISLRYNETNLNQHQLVSIIGDNYDIETSLYPLNVTQRDITWNSTDESVATIDDSGKLSIVSPGTTEISATTENDLSATFIVTAIRMPEGTEWSPALSALPDGIDPQDYSIRYKIKQSDGSWPDEWNYDSIANANGKDALYQFRSFTLTFMSDGKIMGTPEKIDVNSYVDITGKTLEKDGYLFAGWFKSNKAALALDKSEAYDTKTMVKGDMTYYAGWIRLADITADPSDTIGDGQISGSFELEGIGIRADATTVGIRYFVKISSSLISGLKKLHSDNSVIGSNVPSKNIGYGAVAVRRSTLEGPLIKSVKDNNYLAYGGVVTIPAANEYEMYNGYSVFTVYVTGYTADYYDTEFVVRPYITYKDANGFTHTYYCSVTGENAYAEGYSISLRRAAHMVYDSADFTTKENIRTYIFDKFE